MTEFKL